MTPLPDIAVVVISYKQEKTIAAAIDSVLAQSVADRIAEIVVVDDRSPDGSHRIAATYADRDPRLRAIQRTTNSGGASVPRNDGVAATTAPWIAFLDGDDTWLPDRLATQMAALQAVGKTDPPVGLVYGDFIDVDPATGHETPRAAIRYAVGEPRQLARFFVLGGPILPSTALVARWVLDRVGGFDPAIRLNEEADLWLRVAGLAALHHCGQPVMRRTLIPGSLGSDAHAIESQDWQRHITRATLAQHPDLALEARARLARIELRTANAYLSQGDRAAGRRHLRAALRAGPRDPKPWLYLAATYVPGNPQGALRRLRHWATRLRQSGRLNR